MNNAVGNVFLCKTNKDLILHKKTTRKLIIFISIATLLVPCSFCSDVCFSYTNKPCNPKIAQSQISVDYHKLIYILSNPENISVSDSYTLSNTLNSSLNSIIFYFNESITNLVIEEDHEVTNSYNVTEIPDMLSTDYLISIDLRTTFDSGETKDIKFRYNIENEIIKFDKKYIVSYFELFSTYNTYYESVTVRLDKGSEIYPKGGAIIPQESGIIMHPTGIIDIYWNFYNVSQSTQKQIEVKFKPPEKAPVWIFIVGPFVGLTCGIGGTVWFMGRKGKKVIREIGKVFLSDSEKLLLKLIVKNEGKISQRNLCALTGYTKAKVSRNLISLEKQDLITREKWGRNYQVYITDIGKKVIE